MRLAGSTRTRSPMTRSSDTAARSCTIIALGSLPPGGSLADLAFRSAATSRWLCDTRRMFRRQALAVCGATIGRGCSRGPPAGAADREVAWVFVRTRRRPSAESTATPRAVSDSRPSPTGCLARHRDRPVTTDVTGCRGVDAGSSSKNRDLATCLPGLGDGGFNRAVRCDLSADARSWSAERVGPASRATGPRRPSGDWQSSTIRTHSKPPSRRWSARGSRPRLLARVALRSSPGAVGMEKGLMLLGRARGPGGARYACSAARRATSTPSRRRSARSPPAAGP